MKYILRFAMLMGAFLLHGATSTKIVSAQPAAMPVATMASANNPASAHDRHAHHTSNIRRHHHHRHH